MNKDQVINIIMGMNSSDKAVIYTASNQVTDVEIIPEDFFDSQDGLNQEQALAYLSQLQ